MASMTAVAMSSEVILPLLAVTLYFSLSASVAAVSADVLVRNRQLLVVPVAALVALSGAVPESRPKIISFSSVPVATLKSVRLPRFTVKEVLPASAASL